MADDQPSVPLPSNGKMMTVISHEKGLFTLMPVDSEGVSGELLTFSAKGLRLQRPVKGGRALIFKSKDIQGGKTVQVLLEDPEMAQRIFGFIARTLLSKARLTGLGALPLSNHCVAPAAELKIPYLEPPYNKVWFDNKDNTLFCGSGVYNCKFFGSGCFEIRGVADGAGAVLNEKSTKNVVAFFKKECAPLYVETKFSGVVEKREHLDEILEFLNAYNFVTQTPVLTDEQNRKHAEAMACLARYSNL